MRFIFCFLLTASLLIQGASAQVYNTSKSSKNKSTGSSVYNSKGASSGRRGPISIKNMLHAKKETKSRSARRSSSSRGDKPYNSKQKRNNGYALNMTPSQVRAKQSRDRERAKKYDIAEKERRAKRAEERANSRSNGKNSYTERFADVKKSDERSLVSYKQKKPSSSPVYLKDKDGLTMPKKVFGDIY